MDCIGSSWTARVEPCFFSHLQGMSVRICAVACGDRVKRWVDWGFSEEETTCKPQHPKTWWLVQKLPTLCYPERVRHSDSCTNKVPVVCMFYGVRKSVFSQKISFWFSPYSYWNYPFICFAFLSLDKHTFLLQLNDLFLFLCLGP